MTAGAADDRSALRVLRFLGKGDASVREAAAGGRILLDGSDAGVVGVEAQTLAMLCRDGLVDIADGRAALTAAGRMALTRSTATADPFRARQQERDSAIVVTREGRETVTVNLAESPLALLWRRKGKDGAQFLTAREFRAGERLRADYTRGRIMPRMGVNWGAAGASGRKLGGAGGIVELTDAALAARLRVEKAVEAVGPELSGVLIDVCCFLKGLEQVEAERRWPARSAKVVLKSALAALARHYEPPRAGGVKRAILHWGTEGYRPRVGG